MLKDDLRLWQWAQESSGHYDMTVGRDKPVIQSISVRRRLGC